MAQSERVPLSLVVIKTWFSQMAGEAALGPGSGNVQAIFSVFDHWAGRFFSGLEPSKFGPRHCGQLAADAAAASNQQSATSDNLFIEIFDSTANLRRFIHEEHCD